MEDADAPEDGATEPGRSALDARTLLAIHDIGQSLHTIHDLDRLLQFATEQVVTLLNVEGASVILLDEERRELYFRVFAETRAGAGRRLRTVRFPADRGIAGWVLREGISTVVEDVEHDSRFYRAVDAASGTRTRSVVYAPLRTKDRIIGVVSGVNKRGGHFTRDEVLVLETIGSQLAVAIDNARLIQELRDARERLRQENLYLRETVGQARPFQGIVAESPKMRDVMQLVERVLNTRMTVLITGESGSGKELVARFLHYAGERAAGAFIAVNCSAIPETLLEAEVFGYEKGAFTGAAQRKPGRFELASGGTLFLDEIGDMSPALQAKLLRALQEQRFERVGGTEHLTTDARVVAATNRDLDRLIAEGKFRGDLFYRLNVYPIHLPPLRERREDIPVLARHFLAKYGQELRKPVARLSQAAEEMLVAYDWPGNIRELENVIQRATLLCTGDEVLPDDLAVPDRAAGLPADSSVYQTHLDEAEKGIILKTLNERRGDKRAAARALGLGLSTLYRKLKQYGIQNS